MAFKSSLVKSSTKLTSVDQVVKVNATQSRRRLLSGEISVNFILQVTLNSTGNLTKSAEGVVAVLAADIERAVNTSDTNSSFMQAFLKASASQNASIVNVTIDVAASSKSILALLDFTMDIIMYTHSPTSFPSSAPVPVPTFAPTFGPSPQGMASNAEDNFLDTIGIMELWIGVGVIALVAFIFCCGCYGKCKRKEPDFPQDSEEPEIEMSSVNVDVPERLSIMPQVDNPMHRPGVVSQPEGDPIQDTDSRVRYMDKYGRPYFYNASTNQSSWEEPSSWTEEQAI